MSAADELSRCCAACGKQGGDGLHLKRCHGCVVTFYCGKECQTNHWRTHKKECKQLLEEALFQQPPPRDECPICFVCLPPAGETVWNPCCGKSLCAGCVYSASMSKGETPVKQNGLWRTNEFTVCAFCRTPLCASNEEYMSRLSKRMAASDAEAYHNLACKYMGGYMGLERDPKRAEKLFLQAAKRGSTNAHAYLGNLHHLGEQGFEKDVKKAIYHYQIAAIGGEEGSRHNLGNIEQVVGNNLTRAKKHFLIGARAGFDKSLKTIRMGYDDGWVGKAEFADALRSHKDATGETKTEQRIKAQKIGRTWSGWKKWDEAEPRNKE